MNLFVCVDLWSYDRLLWARTNVSDGPEAEVRDAEQRSLIRNTGQLEMRSHGASTSVPLDPKQEFRGSEVGSRYRLPKY
jgi:hypothetical protein